MSKALIRVDFIVKGTFGYLDPTYSRMSQLPDKSNVYDLGVVLFEVLYAKRLIDLALETLETLETEQKSLAYKALKCVEDGTINEMIDLYLIGKIALECFKIYVDIVTSCIARRRYGTFHDW